MKTLMSGLLATTLAASFAFATIAPVNAAPVVRTQDASRPERCPAVQYRPLRRIVGRNFDRRVDRRMDRSEARF